jgi:cytoskeletal protein RodZ
MTEEREGPPDRPSDGPDPSFIKRLEDDSLWSYEERTRMERRADRYASAHKWQSGRARSGRSATRSARRAVPRSRWPAVLALVLAVVVVMVIGLEIKDSGGLGGSGPTTPFSILPLQNNATTTTTEPSTTSGSQSSTTTTESSTTIPSSTVTTSAGVAAPGQVAMNHVP